MRKGICYITPWSAIADLNVLRPRAYMQGRRKLVRTGAAIHCDIGSRVALSFNLHPRRQDRFFGNFFYDGSKIGFVATTKYVSLQLH